MHNSSILRARDQFKLKLQFLLREICDLRNTTNFVKSNPTSFPLPHNIALSMSLTFAKFNSLDCECTQTKISDLTHNLSKD